MRFCPTIASNSSTIECPIEKPVRSEAGKRFQGPFPFPFLDQGDENQSIFAVTEQAHRLLVKPSMVAKIRGKSLITTEKCFQIQQKQREGMHEARRTWEVLIRP